MEIDIFSTPIEDYIKDIHSVHTFEDIVKIREKHVLILDDAGPELKGITEEDFPYFIEHLPFCFAGENPPNEWMEKYGAIPLPKLFIQIGGLLHGTRMSSGFILKRLLDENMATIENGEFKLIKK